MNNLFRRLLCFLGFHDWIYYGKKKLGCGRWFCDK